MKGNYICIIKLLMITILKTKILKHVLFVMTKIIQIDVIFFQINNALAKILCIAVETMPNCENVL